MAFGFPASYTEVIGTVGSRNDTRAAVIGVFQALGWEYESFSPDLYEVRMSGSLSSRGETLSVRITDEGSVVVTSGCRFFQLFDWGKNKLNVREFTARFAPRETREALLGQNESAFLNETGQTPVDRMISADGSGSARQKKDTDAA